MTILTTPKFIVDECLPFGPKELISPEYIHVTELFEPGTPDEILLEESINRGLTIITRDNHLVFRTIAKKREIIYQNRDGERYLLTAKLVDTNCSQKKPEKQTEYILKNDVVIIP